MSDELGSLAQAAGNAAQAGNWQEAERIWNRVRAIDPNHPQALYSLGIHAYRRGDMAGAVELLEAAHRATPGEAMVLLSLAFAKREMGDAGGEWAAINAALAVDAYFLPGLLAKGDYLQRNAKPKAAAEIFRNALKIAPPEPQWPEVFRAQLQQAKLAVDRHQVEFADYLRERLGSQREALESAVLGRWDEAASILAGNSKPYHSDCNQLCVPRLPAIPFFDRALFPWVEALEASTDVIRAELQAALAGEQSEFTPYVAYKPGDPVNQWRELNHSTRWGAYKLWDSGTPVQAHLDSCPATAAALATVEMAQIGGLCPNAMFSALAPHTHIPPHHGETNARLVVHLPLIVPDKCTYRVGFERRSWRVGEVLVFDDTIQHEARNDSDELRVVLIFDVWNPLLSKAERDMVNALSDAAKEFRNG